MNINELITSYQNASQARQQQVEARNQVETYKDDLRILLEEMDIPLPKENNHKTVILEYEDNMLELRLIVRPDENNLPHITEVQIASVYEAHNPQSENGIAFLRKGDAQYI